MLSPSSTLATSSARSMRSWGGGGVPAHAAPPSVALGISSSMKTIPSLRFERQFLAPATSANQAKAEVQHLSSNYPDYEFTTRTVELGDEGRLAGTSVWVETYDEEMGGLLVFAGYKQVL